MKKCTVCAEEIQDDARKCHCCGEWQGAMPASRRVRKDWWDKFDVVGKTFGLLLIPVILAIAGNVVNQSIKSKEVNLRLVEMAVDILKTQPNATNYALREWAVTVVDGDSGFKLSSAAHQELLSSPLKNSDID